MKNIKMKYLQLLNLVQLYITNQSRNKQYIIYGSIFLLNLLLIFGGYQLGYLIFLTKSMAFISALTIFIFSFDFLYQIVNFVENENKKNIETKDETSETI